LTTFEGVLSRILQIISRETGVRVFEKMWDLGVHFLWEACPSRRGVFVSYG
jgi:hypothetical protein